MQNSNNKLIKRKNKYYYDRIKTIIFFTQRTIDIIFIALLAFSGLSQYIIFKIELFYEDTYLQFVVFIIIVGFVSSIISFPTDFYSTFIIDKKFGISQYNFFFWILKKIKSNLIELLMGIPAALAFYYSLKSIGNDWWLYVSILIIIFFIALPEILPVLIYSYFHSLSIVTKNDLKKQIIELLQKENLKIENICSFRESQNIKKRIIGISGIGSRKKILISDFLLKYFSASEILTLLACEVGHYKKRHSAKKIILSSLIVFLLFYFCMIICKWTVHKLGYVYIYDIAAIPIFIFFIALFSVNIFLILNIITKKFNIEAGKFAIEIMGETKYTSVMKKLEKYYIDNNRFLNLKRKI